MEVRPFRLLVDCMAAYPGGKVSHTHQIHKDVAIASCLRTQQQHPHPQALAAVDPYSASEVIECFSQRLVRNGM